MYTPPRYHCLKYPDVDLCPEAYAEGRFPPGCTSRDFVRIDRKALQPGEDGWSHEVQGAGGGVWMDAAVRCQGAGGGGWMQSWGARERMDAVMGCQGEGGGGAVGGITMLTLILPSSLPPPLGPCPGDPVAGGRLGVVRGQVAASGRACVN